MTGPTLPDDGLVHRAVPYLGPEHLAEVLTGPVRAALDRGRRALLVVEPYCRSELERVLGRDAGVRYRTPDEVHTAPPFTVAGRWSRAVREQIDGGATGVCTVGQPTERCDRDTSYWTRLDLALDHAMRHLPVELLCCFRDEATAREGAGALHDELLLDGAPVPSPNRRADHELLREHPQPAPLALGSPLVALPVALEDLAAMRRIVHREAVLSGLGPSRAEDLVLAVNELVSNGIEHGSGTPSLRLWRSPDGLVAQMSDREVCHLDFPGLSRPEPAGARGRGMWLASELTDVLQVWTAEDDPGQVDGTVVRVTMSPP